MWRGGKDGCAAVPWLSCMGAHQNRAGGLSPASDMVHFCTFPNGNELNLVWAQPAGSESTAGLDWCAGGRPSDATCITAGAAGMVCEGTSGSSWRG